MYSISKDKLPSPPEPPIINKIPIPQPPISPIPQPKSKNNSTTIMIILVILVVIIIISLSVGIYLFLEKDKEINKLSDELQNEKKNKETRTNEVKCDCPEIPACPPAPPAPQCPTTICPDCPTTNDISNSLFPGRSSTSDMGMKDMEILDNQDVDSENKKKFLVDQSLNINKNYNELKKQVDQILGDAIISSKNEGN
jgi:hypothetical protein